METLSVVLKKQPRKYLDKLPEPTRGKIDAAIKGLESLSGDIVPLRGAGPNMYRLKIYHYRVIFELNLKNNFVTVREINTRGDIY